MTVRYLRFERNGRRYEGIVTDGDVIRELHGDIMDKWGLGDPVCAVAEIDRYLPPVRPGKIVCLGLNYRDHAAEMKLQLPEEPLLFLKPSTAVIAHGDPILRPAISKRVDYEAELAIVIGRTARHVSRDDADDFILGYACANDVTARDLQSKDVQYTRAKSFDTFAPLGPWIVAGLDPSNLEIRMWRNDSLVQHSSTANLIFPVPVIVEFVTQVMTLLPGDVIITGTPSGVGPLSNGDVARVEIEGIGTLSNPVEDEIIGGRA